jgi:hypothetical protein
MKLLIVGGGISGLLLAHKLNSNYDITLVERNDHLGGRIHSMKHYECGAYRIHQTHRRVFGLAKHLGVDLEPWDIRSVHLNGRGSRSVTKEKNMTWWDLHGMKGGMKAADKNDLGTGYREGTDVSSTNYPMDMKDGKGWWFAPNGLSMFITKLEDRVRGKVRIHLSTRLLDVEKHGRVYKATFLTRKKNFVKRFDRVVFASSPLQVQHTTLIKNYGLPLVSAIKWEPLHRIYAKVDGLTRKEMIHLEKRKLISSTLLGQTIGCPPFHHTSQLPYLQVAYCQGQAARFWQDLLLGKGRTVFENQLTKEVKHLLESYFRRRINLSLKDIDSHYWSDAVHGWKTAFGKPPADVLCRLHPHECPGVYFANEGLSFHQGWIEGSLESTSWVLQNLVSHHTFTLHPFSHRLPSLPFSVLRHRLKEEWVVVDGRVLDVGKWKKVHPGSEKAIENHLYEDISKLWHVIHGHFGDAWRQLISLQIVWTK